MNMNAFKTCHIIGLKVGRHDITGLKIGNLEYMVVQSCCSLCISAVVTVCYAAALLASLLFVPNGIFMCILLFLQQSVIIVLRNIK